MRLYLIRHGETVDNIAGVYAGVRDSQLTVYGVEQTKKLGAFLATSKVVFTHIFASPLIRAYSTAEAIRDAQYEVEQGSFRTKQHVPSIVKVPDLIEQDFGYYEGKAFHARQSPNKTGRVSHAETHKDDPDFQDVESKESMSRRADNFLDQHLMPVIDRENDDSVVAIVSHGILLSTLWRRILLRLSRKTLTIAPEVTAARGSIILEHLGGWSNTGYLELLLTRDRAPLIAQQQDKETTIEGSNDETPQPAAVRITFAGFNVMIVAIDSKAHLIGVKRQRGGIGRLAHDASQRKLDTFFKKPKTS